MKTFREFYAERNGHEYLSKKDTGDHMTQMWLRIMESMADYMDYVAKYVQQSKPD